MAKTYNTISTFTSGQVLTAAQMNEIGTNSNNYRVPPAVQVRRTGANQSITPSASAYVAWNNTTPDYDTDSMWSSGSNTRLTVKTPGIYVVTLGIRVNWTGNASLISLSITNTTSAGVESSVAGYYFRATSASILGLIRTTVSAQYNAPLDSYFRANVSEVVDGTSVEVATDFNTRFSATWLGQAS